MKFNLIILLYLFHFSILGQVEFYQDVFHGGVTGNGFNPFVLEHTGQIDVHIEPGSVIRKAYIFVSLRKEIGLIHSPPDNYINFNGTTFPLKWNDSYGVEYSVTPAPIVTYINDLIVIDVTNYINPNSNSYSLVPA